MYRIKARFINSKKKLSRDFYVYNMPDEIFEDISTSDMLYPYDDGSGGYMPAYMFKTTLNGKDSNYGGTTIVITDIDRVYAALKDRPTILELTHKDYFDIKTWNDMPEETGPLQETLFNLDSCFTSPAWFDDIVDFHIEERKKEDKMIKEQAISLLNEPDTSYVKIGGSWERVRNGSIVADASTASSANYNSLGITPDVEPNSVYLKTDDGWTNVCNSFSITANAANLATEQLHSLRTELENMKKKEEEKSMKLNSITKDFRFGKVNDVRMSIYGPAFNTALNGSEWFAYDKASEDWVDVSPFNFDIKFPAFYMMPVAKDKIATGDFILHCNSWVRIVDFDDALRPIAEDPWKKEIITIMPTKNMFGFDFYTKLVNVFGDFAGNASKDNPFGNMLPFMMMSEGGKMEDMMPMLMMMDGQFDMSNPMMLMAMCGDGKMSDMLPLMMMMNMNKEVKKNED